MGKKLPDHLYVHESAVHDLPELLQELVVEAEALAGTEDYDLAKIARDGRSVSLLGYPDFLDDPHPALEWSLLVNLETGDVKERSWASSKSPPILHRKETFLSPDHPDYEKFAELTRQEADLGLLSRHTIGTRRKWEELLEQEGVYVEDHEVWERTASMQPSKYPTLEPGVQVSSDHYDGQPYLYHWTHRSNVANILEYGLKPGCGQNWPDQLLKDYCEGRVFLSTEPDKWSNPNWVLLQVPTDAVECYYDGGVWVGATDLPEDFWEEWEEYYGERLADCYSEKPIPPELIEVVEDHQVRTAAAQYGGKDLLADLRERGFELAVALGIERLPVAILTPKKGRARTAAVKVDPVRVLEQAQLEGFGGNCGWTAVIVNEELFDGEGEYIGSFNRYRLDQFGDYLGHIVVKYKDSFYDGHGRISQEDLLNFGWLPPDDPDYFDQELDLDQESERLGYDVVDQSDLYVMSREEVLEHMGGSCWVSPEELREQLRETRDAVEHWMNRKGVRTAAVSLAERIRQLTPKFAEEAQKVLDDWVQDEEGYSEEYGSGGVCHIITEESFQSVLADAGIDSTSISSDHEVHVYAVAFDTDTKEAVLVDIRPWCYETGGGYTWRKIPEVVLEPGDVLIEEVDYDDFVDPDGEPWEY